MDSKRIGKILLQDFDERYHPVDAVSGKVHYTGTGMAEIGFRNKCTTVHPYFIITTFLVVVQKPCC